MEHVKISVATLNEVLAYLGNRPFGEVFQHIQKIQQEAQAFIQATEAEAKSKFEQFIGATSAPVPAPDFPPAQADVASPVNPTEAPAPQEPLPVPAQPAVAP